jgi:hypothetical protein
MPRIRKTGDGKTAGEGPAKALPRKRGVRDETGGKSAGTRNIRGPKNSPFNFVGRR